LGLRSQKRKIFNHPGNLPMDAMRTGKPQTYQKDEVKEADDHASRLLIETGIEYR
jgi:hypothetical protein